MSKHALGEEEFDEEDLEEVLAQLDPVISDYIRESREDEDTPTVLGDLWDDEKVPQEAPAIVQHPAIIKVRWISHLIPVVIVLVTVFWCLFSMGGK